MRGRDRATGGSLALAWCCEVATVRPDGDVRDRRTGPSRIQDKYAKTHDTTYRHCADWQSQ